MKRSGMEVALFSMQRNATAVTETQRSGVEVGFSLQALKDKYIRE